MSRISEIGGVDIFQRRLASESEPVTPIISMIDAQKIFACAFSPIHETRHVLPATFNNPRVAIRFINSPRADNAGVAPGRAEVPTMLERVRRIARERAAGSLRLHQFAKPFRIKGGHVRIVSGGAHINLRITRPSEALVALRTIRRQIEKIGALSPDDVLKEAIDHWVGAFKVAGERSIRVHYDALDRIGVRLAWVTADLDTLKAVKRESRHISFSSGLATQNISIRCACLAKILRHEPPIGMQHLSVAQFDLSSCTAFDFQCNHSGKVLSKIED